MGAVVLKDFSWERMIAAVEEVRERACRAAAALRQAGIPHVVVGGHAVASWVARVDKEAVRNTKDVDLLVRREDFPRVVDALQSDRFHPSERLGRRPVPGWPRGLGAERHPYRVRRREGAAGLSCCRLPRSPRPRRAPTSPCPPWTPWSA